MQHMRKTSLRDLHIRTSELVREAEQGSVIVIERRGQPVAELRPISQQPRLSADKIDEVIRQRAAFAKTLPETDVTQWISEDRDR